MGTPLAIEFDKSSIRVIFITETIGNSIPTSNKYNMFRLFQTVGTVEWTGYAWFIGCSCCVAVFHLCKRHIYVNMNHYYYWAGYFVIKLQKQDGWLVIKDENPVKKVITDHITKVCWEWQTCRFYLLQPLHS